MSDLTEHTDYPYLRSRCPDCGKDVGVDVDLAGNDESSGTVETVINGYRCDGCEKPLHLACGSFEEGLCTACRPIYGTPV